MKHMYMNQQRGFARRLLSIWLLSIISPTFYEQLLFHLKIYVQTQNSKTVQIKHFQTKKLRVKCRLN